jgi:hypothetical protein
MTERNEKSSSEEDDEKKGKLDKIIDVVLELLGLI